MCGKLASYGRYHDNRNPLWKNYQNIILLKIIYLFLYVMKKIFYSYKFVIMMSLLYSQSKDTVKNTNFRTFRGRGTNKRGQM